jgi:hypothetical protein
MEETLMQRRRRFDDVMEGVRREIESGELTIQETFALIGCLQAEAVSSSLDELKPKR